MKKTKSIVILAILAALIAFFGIVIFNKTEKNFMDKI